MRHVYYLDCVEFYLSHVLTKLTGKHFTWTRSCSNVPHIRWCKLIHMILNIYYHWLPWLSKKSEVLRLWYGVSHPRHGRWYCTLDSPFHLGPFVGAHMGPELLLRSRDMVVIDWRPPQKDAGVGWQRAGHFGRLGQRLEWLKIWWGDLELPASRYEHRLISKSPRKYFFGIISLNSHLRTLGARSGSINC